MFTSLTFLILSLYPSECIQAVKHDTFNLLIRASFLNRIIYTLHSLFGCQQLILKLLMKESPNKSNSTPENP